ncbi:unnamed protein product, partial [Ixodes hexagonus]
ITHQSLDSLLKILKPRIPEVPGSARSLLHTPSDTPVITFSNGEYAHFGLQKGLRTQLQHLPPVASMAFEISFNIDGLPLFKSSGKEFWCILCSLHHPQFPHLNNIFIVGVFCGMTKPPLDDFLHQFVDELGDLLTVGLEYDNKHYRVSLRAFICDAPARSFVKATKGHNSFYGCDNCCVEGQFHGRMTYPNLGAPLRTDESFADQAQEDHHRGVPPLVSIGVPMVTKFVLDYMHLVCLGVTRRLIRCWLRGLLTVRLPSAVVGRLSGLLWELRDYTPMDFPRKCRGLSELDRWKATEFRFFLLYAGPVVLKDALSRNLYQHFLVLHVAIAILASPPLQHMVDYAEQLLRYYVECSLTLYGRESLVYNVHCLIHLANDCRRYGALDSFSAFPFENFLSKVKRCVRTGNKPLQQLYRRHEEITGIPDNEQAHAVVPGVKCDVVLSSRHTEGPTGGARFNGQFRKVRLCNSLLSLSNANKYVLISGRQVVSIANFLVSRSDVILVGHKLQNSTDLFHYPCPSSTISVFCGTGFEKEVSLYSVTEIICKGMMFPFQGKLAFFLLFHLL